MGTAERVRAQKAVAGRGTLRALWRVLLFLALAFFVFWGFGVLAAPLVSLRAGEIWTLTFASGVLVAALLVASLFMMRGVERRPLAALGLPLGRETGAGLLQGALIGGAFIVTLVVLQTMLGWLRPRPDPGTLLGWLEGVGGLALLLAVAAAAEELLFRGYAFQVLVAAVGAPLAVALSSGLFAVFHLFNPDLSWVALVNIGLAGVILAGAYLRTRSLWVAIGLHWAWNWAMASLFDLPVSGIAFDVPGYDTVVLGPDLLTGGAFGPEGGLVTTLLALPLIVWIYRTSWLAEPSAIARLRPLVDVAGAE